MSVWPPLDGTVTLPETLDFNMKHNPSKSMYIFSRDDALEGITTITFLEFARACHRVAHVLRPGRTGEDGRVVAVIALADTLVYHAIVLGLTRAGLVVSFEIIY
jgi:acyl-CoA synthetase (AMP-forming)/AMP-acid ligase II